jgi:hypothetical protein
MNMILGAFMGAALATLAAGIAVKRFESTLILCNDKRELTAILSTLEALDRIEEIIDGPK